MRGAGCRVAGAAGRGQASSVTGPFSRRTARGRGTCPSAGSAAGGCSRLCASADQDKGTGHSVGAAGGAALCPHAWVEEVTSEREPALCGIHREMPVT